MGKNSLKARANFVSTSLKELKKIYFKSYFFHEVRVTASVDHELPA
jgi:hypothetical protein